MRIVVEIEGITPLLMHRFTEEAALKIQGGNSAVAPAGEKGTPREQAEKFAYRDEKTGQLYMPGAWIFGSVIGAGAFKKVGRKQVTTAKSSLVPAGIALLDTMILLGTKDFEVDTRPISTSTGGKQILHRPRLDKWKASFELDVDETMFSAGFVRELVDEAGKKVGVGSWRPSRKGPFGKFVVTKWNVQASVVKVA